jgi:peptidoglycan hydrolase CwlO-like protein
MNSASQRAFRACEETCPAVQSALDEAFSEIKKHATEKLREALIDAYELVEQLESQIEGLEQERDEENKRADSLQEEVDELTKELEALEAKVVGE